LSDYALQFGLALVVLTVASAAVIISRRNYIKSADFKRSIEALRLEFRRSIDAAQAATTKSARAISENVVSVIEPIDSTVTDLSVRLARLEQHADATATYMAGTQNLDVRLARLEQHADATATHMAGTQKQSLEENERIAAELAGLKQNLKVLSDELSLFRQTIDGGTAREQDINNSIEAVNSRLVNTQRQVDGLLPRLVLGEKERKDLGTLINLFVKRLKKLTANTTETTLRLSELESHFRSKAGQLKERLGSIFEREDYRSTNKTEDLVEDATAEVADRAVPIETNTDSENAGVFEWSATPVKKSSNEASVEGESRFNNDRADQHAT
jgi:chromosome segregation ATPase